MKKSILSILIMMTLGASLSIAQSNTLLASSLVSHDTELMDSGLLNNDASNFSEANTEKFYSVPKGTAYFQMEGSTGLINIRANSEIKYTKAEILSKNSNTTAMTLEMNKVSNSVDISQVDPGTYYMILSNDDGDVFSEKIIII